MFVSLPVILLLCRSSLPACSVSFFPHLLLPHTGFDWSRHSTLFSPKGSLFLSVFFTHCDIGLLALYLSWFTVRFVSFCLLGTSPSTFLHSLSFRLSSSALQSPLCTILSFFPIFPLLFFGLVLFPQDPGHRHQGFNWEELLQVELHMTPKTLLHLFTD